ncbi:PAS domain-containing sensor histidine kinase [Nostoc sp. FACHB-110]|uniref:PAS domain-containing sensor histidine kinase n=1 Tax=Nostoc sp. FACHB-110 TaxID=2692834 RepID=UPI001684ED4C|nr:PAS domain-containing sensor histidine kinase [Nostoc sp. FACHB-110]MBD2437462.1 PAS domain-containing sensor histidine kinase [Nostoc sp. FACHB-110]
MSFNQRSLWHQTQQPQDTLPATPVCLEVVPERTSDLDMYTAQMLQRTQEELQWYRRLYNHTPSIHLSLDITGIILSVNHFGANSLGYQPEQLLQTSIFNLFDFSEKQRLCDALIELCQTSETSTLNDEYRLDCPDSKIVWVRVILKVLPDDKEGLKLENKLYPNSPVILMVCEDITAYKQAEYLAQSDKNIQESPSLQPSKLAEIENLSRLKEEFLSTVSHELRTPLTNMKMAIQMLGIAMLQAQESLGEVTQPPAESSKISRYFEILNNECEREINLINNFLDLQRLDTKAQPWVLETIQVPKWLRQVVEQFQARHHSICKQKISLNIASNLPLIICDPFSLERVLIELLTNACKFSPLNAEITISAQVKLKNMQFQVINSGVEIPGSELTHIFEKFYRIPSNDPWKQGGAGLGLALVDKIIKQLGGTVAVESKSNLTCFMIELPLHSHVSKN